MKKTAVIATLVVCGSAAVLTYVTGDVVSRREPVAVVRSKTVPQAAADTTAWLTEYALTERSGRRFRSQELHGQVHVVNFFFSSCPSVCRLQSGKVQELARDFGDQGVVFLSITCDPTNDTPPTLQKYAQLFNADPEQWLFLTSDDMTYLRRVGAERYQVPVDKQVHSERLVVVDRAGEIRGTYHWNKPAQMAQLREMLHELLAEPPPESGEAGGGEVTRKR